MIYTKYGYGYLNMVAILLSSQILFTLRRFKVVHDYFHTDWQYYLLSVLRFDIYFPHDQAQWRQKYLSKLSPFKHMCSRCVNFLFYEQWTDEWKCFHIKHGSFGYSFCDKNCIPRSVEERVNFELKW